MSGSQAWTGQVLTPSHAAGFREVVLGRSSKVWATLSANPVISDRIHHAIGHKELESFEFSAADRVWILAYSRKHQENDAIFRRLMLSGVAEVVYVSSSSTIVTGRTRCYEYPDVKQKAEESVLALAQAKVLTIGLMYTDLQDLPAGDNIATSYADLATFMVAPKWPEGDGRRQYLFRVVSKPFRGSLERMLFQVYGTLMGICRNTPCVLRPVDLILRTLRMRWYGYVFLSNKLWISMMS
jgi:hypothetical protein